VIRLNRWRRLTASLALLSVLHPVAGVEYPHETLEFLYIDANTGGSSGGHTAVKLDDTVYHFQNDEGYIRLARENWQRFRFVYNDVDNRNIHSARVALRPEDLQRIRDQLSLRFMTQNRQVAYLTALQRDVSLLASLESAEPVEMPGIGFFDRRPHQASDLKDIADAIESDHKPGFIRTERLRLQRRLETLIYAPPGKAAGLEADRYPIYHPTFSEQLEDFYAHWFALIVIDQGWPLRDGALIEAAPIDPPTTTANSLQSNRIWLRRYRDQLREAIARTLLSPYPGSGSPLLLSLARYQAISLSLTKGKFLVLDVLPNHSEVDQRVLSEADKLPLRRLIDQLKKTVRKLITEGFRHPEPDESVYHRLEVAASELKESEAGLLQARPIHLGHSDGPPKGIGHAVIPNYAMTNQQRLRAQVTATEKSKQFLEQMQTAYQYQLITHNCVTELVRTVNASFDNGNETQALGGHLEPGTKQGFVPFRFFELVRRHYRVIDTETLPSQRNRRMTQLSHQEIDWRLWLRESNTLTSSIYRPREGDSAFLMFTEHAFWTRPLLGTLNLGYALATTSAGLITAPTDDGLLLKEGLFGMLFSIPELGLWNIRKGTFNEMSPE
jgi:hypothetical protein